MTPNRSILRLLLWTTTTNLTIGVAAAWLFHNQLQLQPVRTKYSLTNYHAIAEQQLGSFEPLLLEASTRRVILENYLVHDQFVPFRDAWQRQKDLLQAQVDRMKRNPQSTSFLGDHGDACGCDRILLLQHAPVYTLGTGSDERFILASTLATDRGAVPALDAASAAASSAAATYTLTTIPTIRMDRGGEVTYHGPGQLVVYPVLDLRHYRQDVHWYMRALEQVVLVACRKLPLRATAMRQEDTTGIWIDNHKVAAMGIKCSRWITQHGLAVNVERASLSGFAGIVPCGLEGRKVGCLNQFLDEPVTVSEFAILLQEAMEEVFCVRLFDGYGKSLC